MELEITNEADFITLVRFFGEKEHYKFIDNAKGPNQKTIDLACEAVMHSFGSYWDSALGITNLLNNFELILNSIDHRELEAQVEDIICVSAGPGLYADLDALKKHAEKGAFIIACDAVTKLLLKEGIIPKAIITTERYAMTESFFRDVDLSPLRDTILVCSPFSHPGIAKLWPHRLCFLRPVMAPLEWIPWTHPSDFQSIPAVSSVMVQFAKGLAPDRIFLVGQDLAYHPLGKSHANLHNPEYNGVDQPEQDEQSGTQYEAEGYHLPVWTNSFWVEFSMDIGRILRGMKAYSTSSLGLKIPNVGFQSLREADIRPSEAPIQRVVNEPKVDLVLLKQKIEEAELELSEAFDPLKPHTSQIAFTLLIRDFACKEILSFKNPDWREPAEKDYAATCQQAETFVKFFLARMKEFV